MCTGCVQDSSDSGQDTVAGCCKHDNEKPGCIGSVKVTGIFCPRTDFKGPEGSRDAALLFL
jgi:hypothetical protein